MDSLPWESLPGAPTKAMTRASLLVDHRRCVGCHACSVACKTEHDVALGSFRIRTHYIQRPDRPSHAFFPLMCLHCQDAPCIPACPTEAIRRTPDGRVIIDTERCDGQGLCVKACPYGAIALDPQSGKADKCDLCSSRAQHGLEPACTEVCPTGAIRYGDLGDSESELSRLATKHAAAPFKPELKARPSVLHVDLHSWISEAVQGVQLNPGDNDIIYERGPQS